MKSCGSIHDVALAQQMQNKFTGVSQAHSVRQQCWPASLHVSCRTSALNRMRPMAMLGSPEQGTTALTRENPIWLDQFTHAVAVLKTWGIGAVDTFQNVFENVGSHVGVRMVPRVSTAPLTGKVCIVTGGNAGIGLATAELLASRGAHVILACRSRTRGEAAANAIRSKCKLVPGCNAAAPSVEVMEVDMANLNSVRKFCGAFNARKLPLHLLVANAGIMSPATKLTSEDGLEMQFQVNFLSHWLMAHSLLAEQRLRRATNKQLRQAVKQVTTGSGYDNEPGKEFAGWGLAEDGTRVVMVSSLTHHAGIVNWKDMQSVTRYDPFTSYGLSKLANVMTAVELQKRLERHEDNSVYGRDSVVSVHPGVVDTDLAVNFFKEQGLLPFVPMSKKLVAGIVDTVGPMLMKTTASSAATMGVAALAPAEQVAGKYIVNGRIAAPAWPSQDPVLRNELWSVAQKLTGLDIHDSLL